MQVDEKYLDADKLTDDVLKTPPEVFLPENFAALVAFKAARRFAWEEYLKEFLIYVAAITGLILILGAVAFLWLEDSWNRLLQFVATNSVFVGGAIVLLFFILFADKVLLRYFFYRYSDAQSIVTRLP